jgi:uncharacterized membrane protein
VTFEEFVRSRLPSLPRFAVVLTGDRTGAEDHARAIVDRQALGDLLARLPPRQRAVLVLRYNEGLSDDEIAHLLGCRAVSAREYAARARRRRPTRAAWITVIATGTVTAAIPLMVAGRPSGRPADVGPSNAVHSRDPRYGMSTAVPPTSCTVNALPMPDGHHVGSAIAIDPSGRYILLESADARHKSFGTDPPPAGDSGASLWVDGELRRLDVPGRAADVNASGVVVGWGRAGRTGRTGPWILRDGHVSELPGVAVGNANAINATGAVVGTRLLPTPTLSPSSLPLSRPVVWRSPDADAIDLPIPAGVWRSDAEDIDDDGTVVGVVDMGTPHGKASHAYVWFPDGTGRELVTPPGCGLINPVAWSIHNGWVAGAADVPAVGSEKPPTLVGMRWNLRTGEARALPPVAGGAVNRHGWIVGLGSGHGVLITDAGTVQLPDLHAPDASRTSVRGLSDDGRMVVGESNSRPVLWRCD